MLSDRERQIARLASEGLTDKEIARRLEVSITTVRTYWIRMRRKLAANNRAQAIVRALEDRAPKLEAAYRKLADTRLLGILIVDQNGTIMDGNAEFFRLVGMTRESLTAKKMTWDCPEPARPHVVRFRRPDGAEIHLLSACDYVEGSESLRVCYVLSLDTLDRAEQAFVKAQSGNDPDRSL